MRGAGRFGMDIRAAYGNGYHEYWVWICGNGMFWATWTGYVPIYKMFTSLQGSREHFFFSNPSFGIGYFQLIELKGPDRVRATGCEGTVMHSRL